MQSNQLPLKLGQVQLKHKVEALLDQIVSFRLAQVKMATELGFDTSRDCFLKGENSIVILVEVLPDYVLAVLLEMNPLKVEFFDCDQYMVTIDDLVQSLIEILDKKDEQ